MRITPGAWEVKTKTYFVLGRFFGRLGMFYCAASVSELSRKYLKGIIGLV